jgi:hypothetical protein
LIQEQSRKQDILLFWKGIVPNLTSRSTAMHDASSMTFEAVLGWPQPDCVHERLPSCLGRIFAVLWNSQQDFGHSGRCVGDVNVSDHHQNPSCGAECSDALHV